ncbi:MAG: DUF2130 domain-containing protein [Candidatus Saccharimonadales bacterium]
MDTITCERCGNEIELSEVITKDLEKTILANVEKKHNAELEDIKKQVQDEAQKKLDDAINKAEEAATSKLSEQLKQLQEESTESKQDNKELRDQVSDLIKQLRESKKAQDNAEIEMQKKLTEEENKIRQDVEKKADEKSRLNMAAKDKTITDLQKALEDAQRKAVQGSQQLQGEIMELDLESALEDAFRDDDIDPIAKGTKGGDIKQTVKSPRGSACGVMLWEIKRTKNWVDGWVDKLKQDLRAEKANIPIIVTEVLPKSMNEDLGNYQGVWVCKPSMAIVLAVLLRKSLLDAGLQKALAENRGTKADALYNFVTSHEFVQQVESMVETYKSMNEQITKERVAFERTWALREKQAQGLLLSTANIVGSIQGQIGQSSMPKIRGLELLGSGEEE